MKGEELQEFVDECIAEIRTNIHKYPSVCRMLLAKINRLEAEASKAEHDLKNAQLEAEDLAAELATAQQSAQEQREALLACWNDFGYFGNGGVSDETVQVVKVPLGGASAELSKGEGK